MPDLENSALSAHGETTVTVDLWATGEVTLLIENHVATVQLILGSLKVFSDLEIFIRTATSHELQEYEIAGATGAMALCCRQDTRVILSMLGDTATGNHRHQIDIHLYGPRLTEFLIHELSPLGA